MNGATPYRLLVLDDEPSVVHALRRTVNRIPGPWLDGPCEVTGCTVPDAALENLAGDASYDVVVADLRMPGMDGLEFLRRAHELQPGALRIIISGHGDFSAVLAAVNEAHVFGFVPKPWRDEDLQTTLVQALRAGAMRRADQHLVDRVRTGTGTRATRDASMRQLEAEYPGITHVTRDETGAIWLDDHDV